MHALRKSVAPSAARAAAAFLKPTARFSPRFLTTTGAFAEKQIGEEAKYFREQDERKKAAIRAELERVLALDDNSEEKRDVIELLGMELAIVVTIFIRFLLNF
jgi:hypothetical protein